MDVIGERLWKENDIGIGGNALGFEMKRWKTEGWS